MEETGLRHRSSVFLSDPDLGYGAAAFRLIGLPGKLEFPILVRRLRQRPGVGRVGISAVLIFPLQFRMDQLPAGP